MTDVEEFVRMFRPRRDLYVQKDAAGALKRVYHQLTEALIDRHMRGLGANRISFFSPRERRDYIGVDIDDHISGGWDGGKPTKALEEKYRQVVAEIGKAPSMACASPRGIHAFWFLDRRIPNEIILTALSERLERKLSVEILPRPSEALTIPRLDEYLDVHLERSSFPGYMALPRYPAEVVLGEDARPERVRAKLKAGKKLTGAPTRGKDPVKNIENAEAMSLPLENNKTNDEYCRLVGIYKANGLSVDQAYGRFKQLVDRSPGYCGALLSGLRERIETSYRRMKGTTVLDMDSLAMLRREPAVSQALEYAVKAAGLLHHTRSRMAFEEFLLNIVAWTRSVDRVFGNPERAAYWEYLYRGSRRFHREGYYPLTYQLMKQWNSHYDRLLEILKSIGILLESPYGYTATGHRSKYYAFQLFSCRISNRPGAGNQGDEESMAPSEISSRER
jgi:hypothetical protein